MKNSDRPSWMPLLQAPTASRRKGLAGTWKALVWPQGVPVAQELSVDFVFQPKDILITGEMNFNSYDKTRGRVENYIYGGFCSDTVLQFYYSKRAQEVIGSGQLFLKFSLDAEQLDGKIIGLSSHSGELFYSTLIARKGRHADLSRFSKLHIKPRICIGHGRDVAWKAIGRYLRRLGFKVETFESGPRAGETTCDVLAEMMDKADFAILVMTGEDKMRDGTFHARQNVIHEAGLFQGRLGFKRALILLQDGTEEFSNINGLTQLRFRKGHVQDKFDDILSTVKREFPNI